MARMRTIKPSFFQNEDLADLGPGAQLLFAGLWCLADREGRLEDRPRRIKAELFAYQPEFDVDQALTQLATAGFIQRYEVGERRLIAVTNFLKHQRPNPREAASDLPPPTPPPGSPPPNGVTHLDHARTRAKRAKAVQSTEKVVLEQDLDGAEHDLDSAKAQPRFSLNGTGTENGERINGLTGTGTGTENGDRVRAESSVFLDDRSGSSIASDPGEREAPDVAQNAVERQQLAYRLAPISEELGDDSPASSVSRVQALMHQLGLELHEMDNVLKQALAATHSRLRDTGRARVDSPMAFYFGIVEKYANNRASMREASA